MFRRMRKIVGMALAVCLALALTLGCAASKADEPKAAATASPSPYAKKLELLSQTADELYRQAEAGAFAEARLTLIRFGDLLNSIPFQGIAPVEGAHALADAVVQAKKIFNAVQLSSDQALKAAAKIRLAADAVTHPNQPLWLNYYKVLKDDSRLLEQAAASRKAPEAQAALASFKDRYETVRPAVWISREAWEGERLDSLLAFLGNQLQEKDVSFESVMSGVKQLQDALDELFAKKGDKTAYVPMMADPQDPLRWSLAIGALIMAVLSYVAWQMFQGDPFARLPRKR